MRQHCRAFVLDDLAQHAVVGRGDFQHNLIGFDFHDDFIALDRITLFLVPGDDQGVSNGFGESGNFDIRHQRGPLGVMYLETRLL